MKYFYTNAGGKYVEYEPADNETIELGADGVNRVLVNTGTETRHKPGIVLDAVDEEAEEEAAKEAEKKVKEDEAKEEKEIEEKVEKEEAKAKEEGKSKTKK